MSRTLIRVSVGMMEQAKRVRERTFRGLWLFLVSVFIHHDGYIKKVLISLHIMGAIGMRACYRAAAPIL